MSTTTGPRTGPCSPWITQSDVLGLGWPAGVVVDPALAAQMATVASEVLYYLSGQVYTGVCGPVTVRPVQRPVDVDTRFGHRGVAPGAYVSVGMWASGYGQPYAAAVSNYGTDRAPEVDLGLFPVISITQVKLDGILIPANEYRLLDRRRLLRTMPTAGASPTQRYGWPLWQRRDLPDTEPSTFSVTYTYGVAPGQSGINAALALARQLTLNAAGEENCLPQRVTSMTRQGVSVMITDVMDFLSKGLCGIYEVDLFLCAVNPTKRRMKPMAWSPDMGRVRRVG